METKPYSIEEIIAVLKVLPELPATAEEFRVSGSAPPFGFVREQLLDGSGSAAVEADVDQPVLIPARAFLEDLNRLRET